MKKTLLLLLVVLCFASCKKEPDLPDDPHILFINNPFIGVWKAGGEYWQFRTNGTGGKAASPEGTFPDTFSFLIYAGQDVRTSPSKGSIVILDGSSGVVVTRYLFVIEQNKATLTPTNEGSPITLERISGTPAVLTLTNPLIGEWTAEWTGIHDEKNPGSIKWSLKYRADGTVKTYHHGMHQFENAYAVRGNVLVIFGIYRFNPYALAEISNTGVGTWLITEKETNDYFPPADWYYTKVDTAVWK
jgi:hypothetical protein